MPIAGIDIGSNSLILLVVGDDGQVLHDEAQVVGLGQGMGQKGLFRSDRMDVALATLEGFARKVREHGILPQRTRVVGTSAFRRAMNASTFASRIASATGFHVHVISGEEEARITAAGAFTGLNLPRGAHLLVDPGGGSTEVIRVEHGLREGSPPLLLDRRSLETGTVRITESFLGEGVIRPPDVARVRTALQQVFSAVSPEPWPRAVVAVGGSATALAAAQLGLRTFEGDRVHGSILDASAIHGWIDRLRTVDLPQRRAMLPASPDRAETLLAGALILGHVLEWCRRPSLLVSNRGLRFGLVLPESSVWEGRRDTPGRA